MDNVKLIRVSFINIIWVFVYTAQKQEMKYQKNNKNKFPNIKKIINLIFIQFSILFELFIAWFILFCCFIVKTFFSDKDSNFKIIFITVEAIEEYNIWGIWKKILKPPFSSCILCIVSSLKKNPFIVKYKEKDIKNKDNFKENKL